jgi:hypothetical protein
MFRVVERSFVVALSLLLGCSGEGPPEDLQEVGQSIAVSPVPTLTTPLPPILPVPQVVASNVRPTSIALDASNVYYTDNFALIAEVAARPLGGGAKTLLHTTTTLPSSIVRFGSTVYWVDFTNSGADGGVWSAPTGGGSPAVKLASHTNPVVAGRALAVYSTGPGGFFPVTHILYADAWASKLWDIRRSLLGTSEVSLVPDAVPNYYPFALAIDSTHIYFTHDAGHGLWRVPFAGGVPTQLLEGEQQPGALVVVDGQVYFVLDGDIKTKPVAGGATSTFASSVGTLAGMVAANGYLYWACSSCNAIRKKPLAGGSSTLLAAGHANLRSLAVDATHIYFGTDTALKRAPN